MTVRKEDRECPSSKTPGLPPFLQCLFTRSKTWWTGKTIVSQTINMRLYRPLRCVPGFICRFSETTNRYIQWQILSLFLDVKNDFKIKTAILISLHIAWERTSKRFQWQTQGWFQGRVHKLRRCWRWSQARSSSLTSQTLNFASSIINFYVI